MWGRLTLTQFELRVLLVDNIEAALATYDLAVCSALLDRCSCFHLFSFFVLFVTENDSAFRQIVRAHFHLYLIAGKNLNIVHTHLTRDVGCDGVTIFELDTEHCIREGLDDRSVLFNCSLFSHIGSLIEFSFDCLDVFKSRKNVGLAVMNSNRVLEMSSGLAVAGYYTPSVGEEGYLMST